MWINIFLIKSLRFKYKYWLRDFFYLRESKGRTELNMLSIFLLMIKVSVFVFRFFTGIEGKRKYMLINIGKKMC